MIQSSEYRLQAEFFRGRLKAVLQTFFLEAVS